nr:phage tail protein [uncultured Shinella sp.]
MIAKTGIIPIVTAPMLDAGQGRSTITLPAGGSIAEIVAHALPAFSLFRERVRVALVTESGSHVIPIENWARIYPNAGVTVIIRVVPGKDALRSILSIVVSIAAVALGQFWGAGLASTLKISEGLARGLITLGASVLGNLLINALIPPAKPDDEKQNRYTITGWRNRVDPDGAIPVPMGEIRFAPPFAALPYSEIVGDDQYIRAAFLVGYGRVVTEDYRIGDTSTMTYDPPIQIEVREGVAGEAPLSLFPKQIVEEQIGAKLTRPLPRDALGEIVPGGVSIETPVNRTAGADASGASVILGWPGGLFSVSKKGALQASTVIVKIQQRLVNAVEWQDVVTIEVTNKKREAFFRQHTWDFPSRGRWEVQAIMMTDETTSMQISNETAWVALQTIRPEYPFNFPKPVALVAVRAKATHQLNGQLDNFNLLARRYCLDYDHTTDTWIERATRNPASAERFVLQSTANTRPVASAGLDLASYKEWHNMCRLKGLKYDRVLEDASASLRDVLVEIAAAGRAAPRHDGRKWGVVVDQPQALTVDHFSPRNAYGFKSVRSYLRPPHAVRVPFLDQTNDNKPAERIIRWPGYVGDITEVERWEMPGKTDPAEIYRETMRRMYEAIHRPDVWRLSLDRPIGVATRGDKVKVSLDTVEGTQVATRVKAVVGKIIEIDEWVQLDGAKTYAISFRSGITEADTVGISSVRLVATASGRTRQLMLKDTGPMPEVGSLIHFGLAGSESFSLVVLDVEAGEDMSSHLRLVEAAPVIDTLTDALVIPAWSGRIGAEIPENVNQPPAPRFTSIVSGISGTETAGGISYLLVPGASSIITTFYEVQHRLTGAPAWTTITIPSANGGGKIAGYSNGNAVQLRARAKSAAGVFGPYTATISFTVGSADIGIPVALDSGTITVAALLGGASILFSTKDDPNATQVQVYRSTVNVLNRATDGVGSPIPVQPSRGYATALGDTTRVNLVPNSTFDNATGLTLGPGWSQGAGVASHAAGTAGGLDQSVSFTSGKYYRPYGTLSGVTAGTLTPQLIGTTTRAGSGKTTNGTWHDRIQAVAGNNALRIQASSTFVGSLDNLGVYEETATCLAQGVHYVWLEPQNDDGVPGPAAGPFTVTIH